MSQSGVKPDIGFRNGYKEFIDDMLGLIFGKKRFTE
jgi:hypothetical protein